MIRHVVSEYLRSHGHDVDETHSIFTEKEEDF